MDFHIVAVMLLFYGNVKGAKLALRTGGGDIISDPEDHSEKKPSKVMALVIVEDIEESEETNPFMIHKAPMLPLKGSPQIMLPWIESVNSVHYEAPVLALKKNTQIMLPWIESVNSIDYKAPVLPLKRNTQIMMPWIESGKPNYDEDTSFESNSDEFIDSDTESDSNSESVSDSISNTDSESNYYHEDNYIKEKIKKQITKLDILKSNSKVLRNRWLSCQKKASKYCRKACVASYKNACATEKCKKRLKKAFKKECKRNCKSYFIDESS